MCCCNQVVVVTRTFSTETIESIPAMCVGVKGRVDVVNSDFLTKFDCMPLHVQELPDHCRPTAELSPLKVVYISDSGHSKTWTISLRAIDTARGPRIVSLSIDPILSNYPNKWTTS